MKKFFKNISIKYKLLILFNLCIIVPVVLISYRYHQHASLIIKNKSINYSQSMLRIIEYKLNDFANNAVKNSQELLYDPQLYEVLNVFDTDENDSLYENPSNVKDIKDLSDKFREKVLANKEIQSICLIANNKKMIFYDSKYSCKIKQIINYDKMLKKARQANGKEVWYLEGDGEKVNNIFLIRVINDRNSYNETGLMIFLINKDALNDILNNLIKGSEHNLSIQSEQGIIINTDPNGGIKNFDINNDIFQNNRGFIDKKSNQLISYVLMEKTNWEIIHSISLSKLYGEIDVLKVKFIFMLVFIIIIVSLISFVMSYDIIRPIHNLVCAMKKIERGEEHKDIVIDRKDELGYLSKVFNDMARKINYLFKWIYYEQLTRKEAEIKALQAQINPHFLFNTLESINWMAMLNNVPEISDMVTSLSSLMESNIGRDNKLISLEEEMNYIHNYVLIQKNRFGDKLKVNHTIDRGILDIKIPKLLIQPIVENAISHGVEKTRVNVTIDIKGYEVDDSIEIIVRDNGKGIKDQELDDINNRLMQSNMDFFYEVEHDNRKGIGLQNVNRRIKLFYGDDYGLTIESVYTQYTKVIIKIPIMKGKESEGFYV